MITVSAKALWWYDAEQCFCVRSEDRMSCAREDQRTGSWYDDLAFFSGEYAGDRLITDRHLALRVAYITGLEEVPAEIRPLHSAAEAGMADWLACDPEVAVIPDRLFFTHLLDPLEAAGFRIRPLERVKDVHGVCVPGLSWHVVGLLSAVPRSAEPSETARKVAL